MSRIGSLARFASPTGTAQSIRFAVVESWRRRAISISPYFDATWYLGANDDVRRAGVEPLVHFLLHGEAEGRDPGPDFDTAAYLIMNPEARGAALTHFHRAVVAAKSSATQMKAHDVVAPGLRAIESRWFDEAWYQQRHASDATSFDSMQPLVHYYRTGHNPSPMFDHADYQSQLAAAGIDQHPLDHWLDQDTAANDQLIRPRVVSVAPIGQPASRQLVQHRVRAPFELADLDIVVMVHAYYLDVLPSLLRRLPLLPAPPVLLISVTCRANASKAHRIIDTVLGPDQSRIVKVAPNRGRNFAPLLCSFAEEVRDHDYLLHLHTKKSLYSGDEKSDWRNHLVTSLLPSAPGVDAILSLFADDPTVGVVQAPNWEHFPYWGNHWLGNGPMGAKLYERLGVDDRQAHGYVMYPVGGMFWAKVDALRPLLDLALTVGDFDREHGQTDRTLAHAIERTIPAAAASVGFDTVEFDYSAAQWRRNWSLSNAPDFGASDPEALRAALQSADLVSIDLFDTLLLRPALDPDALFDVLSRQFDAAPPVSNRPPHSGHQLVQLRRESESQLRRSNEISGDVTLNEIYSRACAEHPSQAEGLNQLKRLELDLEHRVAIPRTWLIDELLHDRSKRSGLGGPPRRYVLMTDTTQPLQAIEALLTEIGAGDLLDDLYVSNACRARKDTGSMWDLVRELETPAPGRWLHIGDNEFSDIQQASDRGINTFHIPSPGSVAQFWGVNTSQLAPAVRTGTRLVGGHGLAALFSGSQRPGPKGESLQTTAMEKFGYGVLGPLTLSFVSWLTHTARDHEIDRLLFTARDGHLALEVFRRIRPFLPADLPRADYFFMSRRIALALSQHDGEHLDNVCAADYSNGSVSDLLDVRLGFTLPGERGARLGATPVSLPRDAAWLVDQLDEFRQDIAAHGQRELAAFHAYLSFLDIGPDEHLGFVDLGYSGTTQKALSPLIDQQMTGLYYVTTAAANELGPAALSCFGRDATGNSNPVYEHALKLELLCSAEHPQVSRFVADSHGLRVMVDPSTAAPLDLRRHVETAQAAAIRFVHDHIEMFGPELLDERTDSPLVIASLEQSMKPLMDEVAEIFSAFVSNDLFSGRRQ